MSFPINTSIPAASHNPSVDQQPMQQNFSNISGFLGVDHTAPGTGSSGQAGQHNQVTFTLNQSAPSITNGVCGLYANSVSSFSELFFQNSSKNWQMTDLIINMGSNSGTAGGNLNYFDTPWNMRFYFGATGSIAAGTVIFPTFYTTIFTAQATCNDPNAHYVSCQTFTNKLNLIANAGVASINWIAIGRL